MLDKSFASGHGFTDQINNYIAHAHVFMPVLTKESITRSWIQQEIGYGTALNIPVMPEDLVRVAINKRMPRNSHVLIVGNWFLAKSITAAMGKGYLQTIFTRYAPIIQTRLDLFDRELNELLKSQPGVPTDSKRYAIASISHILREI